MIKHKKTILKGMLIGILLSYILNKIVGEIKIPTWYFCLIYIKKFEKISVKKFRKKFLEIFWYNVLR